MEHLENDYTVAKAQILGHDVCDNIVDLPDVLQIPGVVEYPISTEVFIISWGYDCNNFSDRRRELGSISRHSMESFICSAYIFCKVKTKTCINMLLLDL